MSNPAEMNVEQAERPPLLPQATRDQPVWLQVGSALDGLQTVPQRDIHLVYSSSSIRFFGTEGRTPPPDLVRPGQTEPDVILPRHVVLPGLTDAHAHLFLEGGELNADARAAALKRSPAELLADAESRAERLIRFGVVAVRDAGDKDGVGLALSRAYKASRQTPGAMGRLRPYIESPGAAIHHRGRYGSFMADALENHASPADCVRSRVQQGADRIKLIPTGIINFKLGAVTTEPQMSTAEVADLVAAARAQGRQTFAHASGDRGIDRAIDAGVDSVEHGFFLRDDQISRLRDLRIAWVPTFVPVWKQVQHAARMGWDETVVGHLRRIVEEHGRALVRAHERGVCIVAGSDAGSYGVPHGEGFWEELELMERAGLPAIAVLNSATGAGAGRLAYGEAFGRLAPGFLPRFILTEHSPAQMIANLRRPRVVVFDGNVYEVRSSLPIAGL